MKETKVYRVFIQGDPWDIQASNEQDAALQAARMEAIFYNKRQELLNAYQVKEKTTD
jgi:hypothetical protein